MTSQFNKFNAGINLKVLVYSQMNTECLPFANFHKSAELDAQAELKRQNLMF